jgi:hypothetical protein
MFAHIVASQKKKCKLAHLAADGVLACALFRFMGEE